MILSSVVGLTIYVSMFPEFDERKNIHQIDEQEELKKSIGSGTSHNCIVRLQTIEWT